MERHHSWRWARSRSLPNLEEFLLADRAERVGIEPNSGHFGLDSTLQNPITALQPLVQLGHIAGENGVAALPQLELERIVVEDVDELLLELGDLHLRRNALHQRDRVDVLPRAVQQRYASRRSQTAYRPRRWVWRWST